MKRNYPLTLNLGILVFITLLLFILQEPKQIETQDQFDQLNNPMLIALDSIAENYMSEGWTCDAAYLMAGFEVDLYDATDTAEYRLYKAYKED